MGNSPSKKKRKLSHNGRGGDEAPGTGSPEKPFVIEDEDVVKEEVVEEETSFVGGEGDDDNDGDGVDMDDEEELEGSAVEAEGKGNIEGPAGPSKHADIANPSKASDMELTKKEHDIPMFHARRPPHCPSNLIKVGNDRAAITKAKAKKHLQPISVLQRKTPPPPLPLRSKSEQPRSILSARTSGTSSSSTPKVNTKGNGTLSFPVVKKPRQPGSSSQGDKPKTSSSSAHAVPRGPVELSTCPVCLREMQMDNVQLNQHVDYCLSKGTILEAAEKAR